MGEDLSIIIPSAGLGRRMRSYGPKALLQLSDGRTILRRQIDIIHSVFPKADVVVVVGYEAEKVVRTLPSNVRVVENERYDSTGVARSISMGLRATISESAMIVYGDLVFNKEALQAVANKGSVVLVGETSASDVKVGVTTESQSVVHFEYGLNAKWLNIVVLHGEELRAFKKIGCRPDRKTHLGHEVLNEIISNGGELKVVQNNAAKVVEVDSVQEAKKL